jgi:hypothetical protein
MAKTKQTARYRVKSAKKRVLSDTESSDDELGNMSMFTNGHLARTRSLLIQRVNGLERKRNELECECEELERMVKGLRITAMQEATIIKDIMADAEGVAEVIKAQAMEEAQEIKSRARVVADTAVGHMRLRLERAMARVSVLLE